jgi:hypothetical protein
MLNSNTGVKTTQYGNVTQILANVELQASVGGVVPAASGVNVNGKKIVKAGTPFVIDLQNRQNLALAGDASNAFNAILLHDVDVTAGNNNGTFLIFGFVDLTKVESDVQTLIETALTANGHTTLITFLK